MTFLQKLFGKKGISQESVSEVIALIDELTTVSISAEIAARNADQSMPNGIGARISHERDEICDAELKANNLISTLPKILEKIERITKNSVNVDITENDDSVTRTAKIFYEIHVKVKMTQENVKKTIKLTKAASEKAHADADAVNLESHRGMGTGIIESNRDFLTQGQIQSFLAEQRRVDDLARAARNKAEGARELRKDAYESIIILQSMVNSINELKSQL